MPARDLSLVPLFAGLSESELEAVRARLVERRFEPGDALCRQGEAGDGLYVISLGLAHVVVGEGQAQEVVARLRRGDVLGEMSMVTGEPRSATVIALVPTVALELGRGAFRELLARAPVLLDNLVRLLSDRLTTLNRRSLRPQRQSSALVLGAGMEAQADAVLRAAASARATPPLIGDRRAGASIAGLLDAEETVDVLAVLEVDDPALVGVLDHVERAVLLAEPAEAARVRAGLGDHARRLHLAGDLASADPAWLGRYLARGRLGLALGAGGARGYAHVGTLQVMEEAGYSVDAVAGSSIGGVVGTCVAMGMSASDIEATMRRTFTPDTVAALFRLSLGPQSPAMALWTRLLREMTEDRHFSDLRLPLVIMTTDLEAGLPAPLQDGPLWEALLATTALPGLAPPVQRGAQRLVDGLALMPVPTAAVESLCDVSIAINLMSRDTLDNWPGEEDPPPPRASSALDILLEAMALTHTDSSTRNAARADLNITPRFGPSTWKDFHRADAFLQAGRLAAQAQLSLLGALVRPGGPR